jgi:AraC-like DNA-binding protein
MRNLKLEYENRMPLPKVTDSSEDAKYEQITIPARGSFLWRCDDYPWERNVWNYHPEFEIHLVRKSTGMTYVGDYIGNFEPGNLTMVGGNLPHNWITLPAPERLIKERDIVLQFVPETFLHLGQIMPEFRDLELLFEQASLGIEFFGETARQGAQIVEKMEYAKGMERMSLMIALLTLFANSSDTKILASDHFASLSSRGSHHDLELLETSLTFLQDNFLSNPKIGDVANLVGMSETAFSRFFKKQTGNSFTDHLTTLRLYSAKRLLRESDMSVTDVCFSAGFSNISNFNRTFLKQTGLRPLAYRKAAKHRI